MIESDDDDNNNSIKKRNCVNMQMPPPPPPPPSSSSSTTSSSTDGGYLGIPAMSNRLKALEEKILRQFAPSETPTIPTANRTTSRNLNTPIRQIPSTRKKKVQRMICLFLCFNSEFNWFNIIIITCKFGTTNTKRCFSSTSITTPTVSDKCQVRTANIIREYYSISFVFSDVTQAKYKEVLKNSGLLHIHGEVFH